MTDNKEIRYCVYDVESEAEDPISGLDAEGRCNHSPVGMILCPTKQHWQWVPGGPCDRFDAMAAKVKEREGSDDA